MKKQKNQRSEDRRQRERNDSAAFDDLGLEPPKIYRKSQEAILEGQKRVEKTRTRSSKDMTKNQRRTKEWEARKKKNKLRRILVWFTIIILLLGIGTVLSLTVFFHIGSIEASGSKLYSKQEILQACTIDEGENLFMSDTVKASKAIEESLPYIYKAEIKRRLPDKIVISVTDAKVSYSLRQKDKTYILLDDNFKVLEKGAQKAKGISITKSDVKTAKPGKTIEFKNKSTGKCLNTLAECIKTNNFTEITGMYSNNVSDNYVIYDNRITFKLGNCDNLEKKIYQGLATCEKLNESSPNVEGTLTINGDKSIYFTEK